MRPGSMTCGGGLQLRLDRLGKHARMQSKFDKLVIEEAILQLGREEPGLAGLSEVAVIRAKPDSASATAKLNGVPVFLKHYTGIDGAETVAEAGAELALVTAILATTPHRVSRCLATYSARGLIVLEHVPGPRLDHAIRNASPGQRTALMAQSGDWLKAYTSSRVEVASNFTPGWWIKKRAGIPASLPKEDQVLYAAMLANLKARSNDLRGTDITKAATHGDFVSINALLFQGRIYGVDIQGKAVLPVASDVARFLVWTECQTPLLAGTHASTAGITTPDWESFLSSGVLPEAEAQTHLPFFVGLQMLGRLVDFQNDPDALRQLKAAMIRFLDG